MIVVPARKIPARYSGISGRFPSVKNGREIWYESPLERNFMLLLEFNPAVYRYCEQPVTIRYRKSVYKGGAREPGYTPDLIVYYHQEQFEGGRWPDLAEIKPLDVYNKELEESADKYAAANQWAENNNCHFVTWSDVDINLVRLSNADNFYSALKQQSDGSVVQKILDFTLQQGAEVSGNEIFDRLGKSPEIVNTFRHLIATARLKTDWNKPINAATRLTLEA
ncbi:hypothetical protein J2X56_004971 [Herbaspirillum sp. 1173]|uniref:TnsA endonuclease N-terminal domain-containing protein n=1 Tax=Herbaspirillum sp. 1173 TaxID=2817734 RepID=UPI00285EB798|nr:TnsA endonuclease N-terminal domain-containing protein [Herbaspirillum sp. 1173]MDR6742936.1 hypothetical protein [Herbaspirillum sp. 1173]